MLKQIQKLQEGVIGCCSTKEIPVKWLFFGTT